MAALSQIATFYHREPEQRFGKPGWVYVLKGDMTGLMKIGIAVEPAGRMRSLQGASPDRLELVALFHADRADAAERELHRRFALRRSHGEWFTPNESMTTWASQACMAHPDMKIEVQGALDRVWARHTRR